MSTIHSSSSSSPIPATPSSWGMLSNRKTSRDVHYWPHLQTCSKDFQSLSVHLTQCLFVPQYVTPSKDIPPPTSLHFKKISWPPLLMVSKPCLAESSLTFNLWNNALYYYYDNIRSLRIFSRSKMETVIPVSFTVRYVRSLPSITPFSFS